MHCIVPPSVVEPSQVVPMPVETIETTKTSLATTEYTYHDTSTTVTPVVQSTTKNWIIPTTPTAIKRHVDDSIWQEHKDLFISVATCGFVLIVLCVVLVVVLSLYINTRRKQRATQEGSPRETTINGQSSMFSLIPLDTVRRNNLIAFKRRQTAPKSNITNSFSSSMQTERIDGRGESDYEDMYDLASSTKMVPHTQGAKNDLLISMKQNPSYTVVSETQPKANKQGVGEPTQTQVNLEQSENVYDVPIFTRPPPCEYEVPITGSLEISASYVTPHSQPVYYNENTELGKSNTYTEIDV